MVEQAAYWAALLDSGDMTDEQYNEFEAWCALNPLHLRTLERMRDFDKRVTETDKFERDALRQVLKRRRNQSIGTILSIAFVAFAGWAAIQSNYVHDLFPDYQTKSGHIRTVVLNDGSEIMIGSDAALNVYMNGKKREIRLIRGQILAKVDSDQPLPFIIKTQHGSATALGTSFIVRREADHTQVAVIESRVRICPEKPAMPNGCTILAAGQQAGITSTKISSGMSIGTAGGIGANEWLEADDTEVVEIINQLNRYRKRPIRFNAASLRGIRVTGSFPLLNAGQTLDGMASTADIMVRYHEDGEITVTRRR